MNFLAHAWLAHHGSDDFLYGNLIADGVKGSDLSAWPLSVAAGIRHHRRVDALVDHHPRTLAARGRAPEGLGRYAPIALDLVWDHFLSRLLADDTAQQALIVRCYRLLDAQPAPARLAAMVPVLVEQDWLNRYADFGFTCRAIAGIGQRLSGPNRLAELLPWLDADYSSLEADFRLLWPDMEQSLGAPGVRLP
ncbi:ACP phosphodiesterase [Halomonas sp. YLGW01]|uniref:acyl carrier protein phosphodiesterase n=1 Tax=Halomonas sp. YLGW01 TaxID=2773308 RepID=UPI0017860E21|nr:ACP phosphodiesterase [Halomonas sp. YLGW01]